MAKKKITRKQLLKKEDEFLTLSSRVANFIGSYQQRLKYIGFTIGVIILAYLGAYTYLNYVNKKGQGVYNEAYNLLASNMKPDADHDKLKKSEELFRKVVDDYGLSKAAGLALSQIAYLECRNGNYDEAIALYRKFSDKVSGKVQYEALGNMAIATCYESKGDFKKAIEILSTVVEVKNNPFGETAMLNLARIYRSDNQQGKAKEVLKNFIEQHKSSPFVSIAKTHL